jgi:hypothetical protein
MTLSNRSEGRNWFSHHDTFALNPRELQKLRENQWSPSLLLDYASIVFLIFNILLILSIQLWINVIHSIDLPILIDERIFLYFSEKSLTEYCMEKITKFIHIIYSKKRINQMSIAK